MKTRGEKVERRQRLLEQAQASLARKRAIVSPPPPLPDEEPEA